MKQKKAETESYPNPGSDEAIKLGCRCAIWDNFHGAGFDNGKFWINEDCPLHGRKQEGNDR